jgi:hypothetical protein
MVSYQPEQIHLSFGGTVNHSVCIRRLSKLIDKLKHWQWNAKDFIPVIQITG